MELIENQPERGASGKSTQSQIPHLLPKYPPLAPHPPQPIRPELVDPKRKRSRKGKMWSKLGNLIRPVKMRPSELRSNKRSATRHNEAWRERTLSFQSPTPDSLHPCSAVSPWEMMHHSGTSTGALGATLLWPWRRPCYFQKICPSYGISGRMRSSSIVKDIWAW